MPLILASEPVLLLRPPLLDNLTLTFFCGLADLRGPGRLHHLSLSAPFAQTFLGFTTPLRSSVLLFSCTIFAILLLRQ